MELIYSKNNAMIKQVVKLISSSKARREAGAFFAEGLRLCLDVLHSDVQVQALFVTEECLNKNQTVLEPLIQSSQQVFQITPEISQRLADTSSPQGIFCVCKMMEVPEFTTNFPFSGKLVALEQIQDPANLGAICRTAEALGLDGALLCGCCDVYNPKTLRASMGSLFRLPLYFTDDLPDALVLCREQGMSTLACVPDRSAEPVPSISMENGVLAVIGNEGSGLCARTQDACTNRVTIPMEGRAESLNAAMAAAILMWEMMRGGQ